MKPAVMKAPYFFSTRDVQDWLKEKAEEPGGAECPCCGQLVKTYRRSISPKAARWLLWLCKYYDGIVVGQPDRPVDEIWISTTHYPVKGGDYAKLRHWGLVRKKPKDVSDKSRKAGMWQPTGLGIRFAKGQESVPKYCYMQLGQVISKSVETIHIGDILKGEVFQSPGP